VTTTYTTGALESRTDYEQNPREQAKYWETELKAAQKRTEKWQRRADAIVLRYLGQFKPRNQHFNTNDEQQAHLNMFYSNTKTLLDMLYGSIPRVDVSRRHTDVNDDVARVAAETLERLLNMDIADHGAEYDAILRSALQDRMLAGLGAAKVRYTVETTQQPDPMTGEMVETLVSEDAPIEYYYWGDIQWGWARNFADVPWIAFRSYLTKDEISNRFGPEVTKDIPLKSQQTRVSDTQEDPDENDVWMKAEIWEIWDKVSKTVVWYAPGYHSTLDRKPDPLQLTGFFPTPPFMIANPTTALYHPTPDFTLAQDLYNEADVLQARISILTRAVKAVGVYDGASSEVQRMFNEGVDNTLIPVENWALFGEKQGLKGVIDWVPIQDIVNALDKLRDLRNDTLQLLQQVTGMADVMRGQLDQQYEGVGQTQLKAQFGSVRIQALQDQFSRFASDLLQIKAEVIARHFSPQTIVKMSNMQHSLDQELLPAAVDLIKRPNDARLSVTIRSESLAMVDYAKLKSERTEFLNALGIFLQSAAPLIQEDPKMKPFTLQLLQWGLAGFRGASEIEGVVDKAIDQAMQDTANQQEKPDPQQQKLSMQMQIEQLKAQAQMQSIQAKAQADLQNREADKQADIETAMASHRAKIAEIDAELRATLAETQAKMRADVLTEQAQAAYNVQQTQASATAEIEKDAVSAQLDIEKEIAKTELEIAKLAEQAKREPTNDD
jgi:hypothetical protein